MIDLVKTIVKDAENSINLQNEFRDFTLIDNISFGYKIEDALIDSSIKHGLYGYHDITPRNPNPDFICLTPMFTTEYKSHRIQEGEKFAKYNINRSDSKYYCDYYKDKTFNLLLINYDLILKDEYKYIYNYNKEIIYHTNIHKFKIKDFYIIYNCTYQYLPDDLIISYVKDLPLLMYNRFNYDHIIM